MTALDPYLAGALAPPRRNKYFYGKLLDVPHLEMEQRYARDMRLLGNRLGLGAGVLCGLRVTAGAAGMVMVGPGVAVDAAGREIVVSEPFALDPWRITDGWGGVAAELPRDVAHTVSLCLAHTECLTDFAPALVTDCAPQRSCEAGTVVEAFRVDVREGSPDSRPSGLDLKVCDALFGDGAQPGPLGVVDTLDVGGAPAAVAVAGARAVVATVVAGQPLLRVLDVDPAELGVELADPALQAPFGGMSVAPEGGPVFATHAGGIAVVDLAADPPALLAPLRAGVAYGPCAAAFGGSVLFALDPATGLVDRIDVATGAVERSIDAGPQVSDLAVAPPDSRWLYVARAPGAPVARFDTANDQRTDPSSLAGVAARTVAVRNTGAGAEVRLAAPGLVRVIDDVAVRELPMAIDPVDSAFSSDGGYYALASVPAGGPPELVVVAADDATSVVRVPVGAGPVGVAIVPGGLRALVANGGDGTVTVVDLGPPDRYRTLCRLLVGDCAVVPENPCVHLATVELRADGTVGAIDGCGHRSIVLSNAALLNIILCIAARVDACCAREPEPPVTIAIEPAALPAGRVGDAYPDQDVTASGGTAPYVLVLDGGALPPGLTAQQTGPETLTVTGTPTQDGSFGVVVKAVDADGRVGVRGYGIDIAPPDNPPGPTMRIDTVHFLERQGPDLIPFEKLGFGAAPQFPAGRMDAIRVIFTRDVDASTVTTVGAGGVPPVDEVSFRLWHNSNPLLATITQDDARTVTYTLVDPRRIPDFPVGEYRVELIGDDVPFAIRAADGTRLDGDGLAPGFPPSGDGSEGGTFSFDFQILP